MSTRRLGAALGFGLGIVAMLAPIGLESWFPGNEGYLLPPGLGAVVGGAIAGALLAQRAAIAPARSLGVLALAFSAVAAACAAPFFAIEGAIWSVTVPAEPGDELFHPGPLMSAVFDVFFFGAVTFVLAIPQGIAWVWLMTRLRRARDADQVTFGEAD